MKPSTWLPRSLAGRFGIASAAMAAVAVLLVSLTSWWVVDRQQDAAQAKLASREREFHAANVASTLRELSLRMREISGSTILATGLVDSAGKETYLGPFINGVRQVNGIPIELLFTDYEGKEIASNSGARFSPQEVAWLKLRLAEGREDAAVMTGAKGPELLAVEPLRYARTDTPEGALLYKIAVGQLLAVPGLRLEWGEVASGGRDEAAVPTAPLFKKIGFRVVGEPSPLAAASERTAPEYPAIAAMALLLFAALLLVGRALATLLTRDLSRLEVFSSRVVTAALPMQRAPEGGSDEVASLAHSINRMLDRLHNQHEALAAEGAKLSGLAEALKVADRRKDEFLAMLAHELRNPLAPISTGAEILRRSASGLPQVQRTTDVISRQVRHMTKIVDDLLDVSRVTRGMVTLDRSTLDLRTSIFSAVEQVREFAETRRQHLEVAVGDEPLWVCGDASRLVQIASNLLHNACKYSPEGGQIGVAATAEGDEVMLMVRDNGSGISPEFMPELFGLFTQDQRSSDRAQGGLGLGLALVKRLVELHGGSVRAESDGVGAGAIFVVQLPRVAAPVEAAAAADDGVGEFTPLRVMVVDDNVDAADTLAALLEGQGHGVEAAYSADVAMRLAKSSQPFDTCILDIGLPLMDGHELARELRRLPGTSRATFIALTGYGQAADKAKSVQAGFAHHLVKPVDPGELTRVLATR